MFNPLTVAGLQNNWALGLWLLLKVDPTLHEIKEGAFMIINPDKYSKISLVSSDMLVLGYKNQKRI